MFLIVMVAIFDPLSNRPQKKRVDQHRQGGWRASAWATKVAHQFGYSFGHITDDGEEETFQPGESPWEPASACSSLQARKVEEFDETEEAEDGDEDEEDLEEEPAKKRAKTPSRRTNKTHARASIHDQLVMASSSAWWIRAVTDTAARPKLGLDLAGGTSVILHAKEQRARLRILKKTASIIEARVNATGRTEPRRRPRL